MPLFGCLLFGALYVTAAFYYPGGSPFNKELKGFSWTQNYWCNLLGKEALNGQINPARPVALAATVLLCTSLICFWFVFPLQVGFNKRSTRTMQLSGLLAMTTGLFLFTSLHDVVINVATAFGLVSLAGTFVGLKKLRWNRLFLGRPRGVAVDCLEQPALLRQAVTVLLAPCTKNHLSLFPNMDRFH